MNIIFLDIDGVLNCQVFYENYGYPKDIDNYERENICELRLKWLTDLCHDTNSKVVISSSWRSGRDIKYFQDTFDKLGGIFEVIGKTPWLNFYPIHLMQEHSMPSVPRGCEIKYWLDNTDFKYDNYAIIDDDGDMLLEQASHFFQTDVYAGLTPWTCQKIRDYFSNK